MSEVLYYLTTLLQGKLPDFLHSYCFYAIAAFSNFKIILGREESIRRGNQRSPEGLSYLRDPVNL